MKQVLHSEKSSLNLVHLIYTSVADPVLRFQDYKKLVNRANQFNQRSHITGLLVMSRLRFVQILEGDPHHLKPLYDRIEKDPRHHKVELVEYCEIDARRYSEWGMRLVYLDELDCFHDWKHVFDHSGRTARHTYPANDYLNMLDRVREELIRSAAPQTV